MPIHVDGASPSRATGAYVGVSPLGSRPLAQCTPSHNFLILRVLFFPSSIFWSRLRLRQAPCSPCGVEFRCIRHLRLPRRHRQGGRGQNLERRRLAKNPARISPVRGAQHHIMLPRALLAAPGGACSSTRALRRDIDSALVASVTIYCARRSGGECAKIMLTSAACLQRPFWTASRLHRRNRRSSGQARWPLARLLVWRCCSYQAIS